MSGAAFVILAWIFLGAELGLKDALALGPMNIAPSFMFCLLTFLAMFTAPPRPSWIALALGIMMDLTFRIPLRDGAGSATIIGPYAISYLLSVQLITALRGVVIKRNPLTMGFLALVGSVVCNVSLVAIFTFRLWYGDPIELGTHPSRELLARLASCAYTGGLATLLALVLFPAGAWMGIGGGTKRR